MNNRQRLAYRLLTDNEKINILKWKLDRENIMDNLHDMGVYLVPVEKHNNVSAFRKKRSK